MTAYSSEFSEGCKMMQVCQVAVIELCISRFDLLYLFLAADLMEGCKHRIGFYFLRRN